MSDKGFFPSPRRSFFSAESSSNAHFTGSNGFFSAVVCVWGDWTGDGSLLLHLAATQPQEAPQLPPAWRHWHFVVLHRDFLLHEQHTPDPLLFRVTSLVSEHSDPNKLFFSFFLFFFFTDCSLVVATLTDRSLETPCIYSELFIYHRWNWKKKTVLHFGMLTWDLLLPSSSVFCTLNCLSIPLRFATCSFSSLMSRSFSMEPKSSAWITYLKRKDWFKIKYSRMTKHWE